MNPASRTGIIGYTYVLSDDGQFALVEFVARDASAFQHILAGINGNLNVNVNVKAFRKGRINARTLRPSFASTRKTSTSTISE